MPKQDAGVLTTLLTAAERAAYTRHVAPTLSPVTPQECAEYLKNKPYLLQRTGGDAEAVEAAMRKVCRLYGAEDNVFDIAGIVPDDQKSDFIPYPHPQQRRRPP